jgi:hypothetical protein
MLNDTSEIIFYYAMYNEREVKLYCNQPRMHHYFIGVSFSYTYMDIGKNRELPLLQGDRIMRFVLWQFFENHVQKKLKFRAQILSYVICFNFGKN